MLFSVLHNQRALGINVAIMRAFVQMQRVLAQNVELLSKIDDLEFRRCSILIQFSTPLEQKYSSTSPPFDRLRASAASKDYTFRTDKAVRMSETENKAEAKTTFWFWVAISVLGVLTLILAIALIALLISRHRLKNKLPA